eukprot:TRINITY_DN2169_c0_g2_i1.p1 TRINITY_DN2169_c0_g2~~TRINITY_DN2169_c0_g2_i1.p1  ORF type:complete len:704 (-),score=178.27 TRINITY_DN2169_c0_g2_i1:54-2165(-)
MTEKTDLTQWKLTGENGRQVWKYIPGSAQQFWEKYLLGLDISKDAPAVARPKDAREANRKAITFFQKLQMPDGHWANDYGGPLFLMPGLIIACYFTKTELPVENKLEMIRYMSNQQREDGGWGLHVESETSTMFGTALQYVSMRILGLPKEDARLVKARKWMDDNGSPASIPSWGKFWLSVMGVYSWDGLNPLTTEMWLLPYWIPMHPGRFWCHCRVVYMGMSYLYGKRATVEINPFITSLREELYPQGYNKVDWPNQKWNCCPKDLYTHPTWLTRLVFGLLAVYENYRSSWLRQKAIVEVYENIKLEDQSTKYVCIGPVNKTMNMIAAYIEEGKDSPQYKGHVDRLYDYLWLAEDGMKMQGYNGCQLWDTAFALQAICETQSNDRIDDYQQVLIKGHAYLESSQVREDIPADKINRFYRHISKGAWPFSTRDHGWPISDCTGEGLKAALLLRDIKFIQPLEDYRYEEAVNVILSLQNSDGGWPTYELQRSGSWLEKLNPSEVFHDIMVDYSYVECTSSAMGALCSFRRNFPNHRRKEIDASIERGISFIRAKQRPDGSWIGSWAVCFTYAIWYVIDGLVAAGVSPSDSCIQRACKFLASKQKGDGGWGETFMSCVSREYSENDVSQTVNTAWACLALIKGDYDRSIIDSGIKNLMEKQLPNGDWKLEGISGVFNANCAIAYNSYKNTFSIWALGRYANKYLK